MAFEFDMRGIADPAIQGLRSIKDTIRSLGEGYRGTIARAGDRWANRLEADKQRDFARTEREASQEFQSAEAEKRAAEALVQQRQAHIFRSQESLDAWKRQIEEAKRNREWQDLRDQAEQELRLTLQKNELTAEEKMFADDMALKRLQAKWNYELGQRGAATDEQMADTAQFRAQTERMAELFDQKMQRESLDLEKDANEWRQAVAEEANRLQARGLDIDEERLEYEALPEWIKNDFPTFEEWKQWTLDLRSSGTSQDLESQLGIQYAMAVEKTLDALRQTGEEAILLDKEGYMKPWRTLSEEDKQRVLKEFGRIVQNTTNERLLLDMMQEKLEFGAEPEGGGETDVSEVNKKVMTLLEALLQSQEEGKAVSPEGQRAIELQSIDNPTAEERSQEHVMDTEWSPETRSLLDVLMAAQEAVPDTVGRGGSQRANPEEELLQDYIDEVYENSEMMQTSRILEIVTEIEQLLAKYGIPLR
jgi:hypothetical protein